MNFLSQIHGDDAYQDYLNDNPSFSMSVISNRKLRISEGLSRFSDSRIQFRVNYFSDLQGPCCTNKDAPTLTPGVSGILKSNWCSKHFQLRCSCVVFCLDWDQLGETAIDEIWLSTICKQIKDHVKRFRCSAIVALTTEKEMKITVDSTTQMEQLQHLVKMFLGNDFKGVLALYGLGMDRESAEKLFHMAVELSTEYHKNEVLRLKSSLLELSPSLIRRDFKIGWHSLVLNDTKLAKKYFASAYKTLRTLATFWPSLELRVCGTILLFRVLCIASRESPISSDDSYFQVCEEHIMWVGKAFCSNSSEFKPLAGFLRLMLLGECYEWLIQNVHYVSANVRRDNILTAVDIFEEAIKRIQLSATPKKIIPTPVFVGTECCLDSQSWIFPIGDTMKILSARLKDLLSTVELQQSNLFLDAHYICTRANISLQRWDEAIHSLEKFEKLRVETYREAEAIHHLWMSVIKSINESKLTERNQEDILFSFVSLCFGPTTEKIQSQYMKHFIDMITKHKLNLIRLSYPRRDHFPPFTVLCSFQDHQQVCATATELRLMLFTNSVEMIVVDSIFVTISRLSSGKRIVESVSKYSVSEKGSKFNLNECFSSCLTLTFDEPGIYHCTTVQGCIKCSGISLNVEWILENSSGNELVLREREVAGSMLESLHHKPWIKVVRPVCRVDIDIPNSITVIEGEEISIDIVVKPQQDLTGNGGLIIYYVTDLYEFIFDERFKEEEVKVNKNLRKGYRTVLLDNAAFISRNNPLVVPLKYKCLRAGKYMVPILFYYRSTNYSDMEIPKRVQLNVLYPFSPTYTFLNTLPWMVTSTKGDVIPDSEIMFNVPDVSRTLTQHEKFTLVHPRQCLEENLSKNQSNRNSLVYISHIEISEEKEPDNLIIVKGGEFVLLVSMECQALQGLTVEDLDVICTHNTSLLSLTVGVLPCHVEHLEVLSFCMKFSVVDVGSLSLGFLRMTLLQNNGMQRIVSDFPLPKVKVEDAPFMLSLRSPSIAFLDSPFLISVDVKNKTENIQTCELVVEKVGHCFLMSGRSQLSFSLAPDAVKTTELILQPLCVGTVCLPSVFVRHTSGVACGTSGACLSASQKICILPS